MSFRVLVELGAELLLIFQSEEESLNYILSVFNENHYVTFL